MNSFSLNAAISGFTCSSPTPRICFLNVITGYTVLNFTSYTKYNLSKVNFCDQKLRCRLLLQYVTVICDKTLYQFDNRNLLNRHLTNN
jgi:hypothetical protein